MRHFGSTGLGLRKNMNGLTKRGSYLSVQVHNDFFLLPKLAHTKCHNIQIPVRQVHISDPLPFVGLSNYPLHIQQKQANTFDLLPLITKSLEIRTSIPAPTPYLDGIH